MSDGQLRVRIRAYEREKTWAPRYVANELAGTTQIAEQHRHTAALRHEETTNSTDAHERARLEQEATEAAALAEVLDQRGEQLATADQARAEWYAHTAATRAAADRAQAELAARHMDEEAVDQPVTAEEWLAVQRENIRVEDPHREITDESQLADAAEQRARDTRDAETAPTRNAEIMTDEPHESEPALETDVPDVREIAAPEPQPADENIVRTPSVGETTDTIGRAQRALAEVGRRCAAEEQHAAEEEARTEQLARWHAEDVEHEAPKEAVGQAGPTLDMARTEKY